MLNSFGFKLGQEKDISRAFKIIEIFTESNNRDNKRFYKSFRSLSCSREDLIRSFYFIQDCIFFCEDQPIYNNKELLSSVKSLHMSLILSYIDIEPELIPLELIENIRFGKKYDLMSNLGIKQITELGLIDWRTKEHWLFWANSYGTDDIVGQFCLERSKQPH